MPANQYTIRNIPTLVDLALEGVVPLLTLDSDFERVPKLEKIKL